MQSYLEKVKVVYELYRDGGQEPVFYFIILIILLIISKNNRFRKYILYPIFVELIFICNPISIAFFLDKIIPNPARYVRLFWLPQVALIIVGAAYECIQRAAQKSRKKEWATALLLTAVVMIMGNYTFSEENFQKADNSYKLPNEVIEVTDRIKEDCKNEGKELSEIRIVAPMALAVYIRQYDGNIKMLYGRYAVNGAASLMQETELNIKELSACAKDGLCNYIVLEENKPRSEEPEEYGYELIDSIEGYLIYRDNSFVQ